MKLQITTHPYTRRFFPLKRRAVKTPLYKRPVPVLPPSRLLDVPVGTQYKVCWPCSMEWPEKWAKVKEVVPGWKSLDELDAGSSMQSEAYNLGLRIDVNMVGLIFWKTEFTFTRI